MEQILNEFGIEPVLLAAQIVNFAILLWVLKKFLYGPILKVLEARRQAIEESVNNAEKIEKSLVKTEEEYQKRLNKATDEARQIVDDATKSASGLITEARSKATEEMEEILKKGQAILETERHRMYLEMRSELVGLVVTTLEKVTGKVLNNKDQLEIIEKAAKNIN